MKLMYKKIKKATFLALLMAFIPSLAKAQNFYWEKPRIATDASKDCRFPEVLSSGAKSGGISAVFWQDVDKAKKEIYISMTTSWDGQNWSKTDRFAGPYSYSGEIPQIYSAAQNSKGRIAVAVVSSTNQITVLMSEDYGKTFTEYPLEEQDEPLVGARIHALGNGNFIVFATLANKSKFNLVYSRSSETKKGTKWEDFDDFNFKTKTMFNPIAPNIINIGFSDMMVFQAQYSGGGRSSFQIFASTTSDGGKKWSEPVMITGGMQNATSFNNQRPSLFYNNGTIYLAWERASIGGILSSIYVCTLNSRGEPKDEPMRISRTGNAVRPFLFNYDGNFFLTWTDSQNAMSKVLYSKKTKALWSDPDLIVDSTQSTALPVLSKKGESLSFVWLQNGSSKNSKQILMLFKDSTILPPVIKPVSFEEDKGGTDEKAVAEFQATEDSSGIMGFSYIFTDDKDAEPPEKLMRIPQESTIEGNATKDGFWYFKVKQTDYAENWSKTTTLTYRRDTTAPLAPTIEDLEEDESGMLKSNTFKMSWKPQESDGDVAGYTWSLKYIAPVPRRACSSPRHPLRISPEDVKTIAAKLMEDNKEKILSVEAPPLYLKGEADVLNEEFNNIRNGLYVFSVAAIDKVGNIGKPATKAFAINKYIPVTYITAINSETDVFGDISLDILGGNFDYDGNVTAIYLDKDGKAPYDYILTESNNDFEVVSENRITNILLRTMDQGDYYIGLNHSDRGLYITKEKMLHADEHGTVKTFKKFKFVPEWVAANSEIKKNVNITKIAAVAIILLAIAIIVLSIRGLSKTAGESIEIHKEIQALIEGGIMPQEKKNRSELFTRKGIGLSTKMMAWTTLLLITIVALVILALSYIMIAREETTRVQGLQQRAKVLLDSMANGAKVNLPNASSNLLALTDLTDEAKTLTDSRYAVITGYGSEAKDTNIDYVWASNDANIASKTNTSEFVNGKSRLTVEGVDKIQEMCKALNAEAESRIKSMTVQISELTAEGISLTGKADEKSIARIKEIGEITRQLNSRVNYELDEISKEGIGTYPNFDSTRINYKETEYLFFKPVVYHYGNEETYVHGIVFLQISTQSLIAEMHKARMAIAKIAAASIAAAILIGILSASILAGIIVRPIKKLARHVAMIRDTDDKEKLSGKEIKLRMKDEMGMLGDTVNEMTKGLVEAAIQMKNLTFGKEIQTKFLPLQQDQNGNTLTTGSLKTDGADFFSYYAGADDLSGDYFDYRQIDKDHYAIIKCDVSGHGVPAALIMVQVATLFLNAFRYWNMNNGAQNTNLSPVVEQINDLIESRGFKGRFAAFTLGILNIKTGECWFCNAGDNIVPYYDGKSRQKKFFTLPETPAAGMFSSDLISLKGGYPVVKHQFSKGDVLLLYTDGIEEAKRNFRNAESEIVTCEEPGLREGEAHENHIVGESSEEMSAERVKDIVESVFEKKSYTLKKCHDESGDEFTFDFSNCEGSAEDAIMALVSVEKVFRMYRRKNPNPSDRVKVDRKIDEFLRLHFKEYSEWCMNRSDIENDPIHIYYHGILEDPQFDDLTLIAIKKN